MNLYIVRHGETQLNKEARIRGWIDVPLSGKGLEQSAQLAELFSDVPIQRIYSSDLQRAMLTAELIGFKHGIAPYPRAYFRPLNFGELNGEKWEEARDKVNEWINTWKRDPKKKIPDGDSFHDFQERNLMGLRESVSNVEDGQRIVIVTSLRNCVFFRAYADNDSMRIHGDNVDAVTKLIHKTGEAAKFYYEPEQEKLMFLNYMATSDYIHEARMAGKS